ncbi:MAG: hypothetical protein ABIH86_03135 [Planctomycetota bacterium]
MPKGKTAVNITREDGRVKLTIETDSDRWEEAYSQILSPAALSSARKATEALAELEDKLNPEKLSPDSQKPKQ